jgi:hypothetical protein
MRRSLTVLGVAGWLAGALVGSGLAAGGAAPPKTFYLDLKPGQCAIQVAPKFFQVVACSNAGHRFEVFAVLHAGWGTAAPPGHNAAFARAKQVCLSTFRSRYGGAIRQGYGWWGYWPDAGAETAKYSDRLVCTLIRWPGHPPMGAGTHLRQAVA